MEAASKAPVHWVRALTTVLTPPAVVLGFESRYRRRYYWVQAKPRAAALKALVHVHCVRRRAVTMVLVHPPAVVANFDSHRHCCYWVQQEPPSAALKVLAHHCARALTTVLAPPAVVTDVTDLDSYYYYCCCQVPTPLLRCIHHNKLHASTHRASTKYCYE